MEVLGLKRNDVWPGTMDTGSVQRAAMPQAKKFSVSETAPRVKSDIKDRVMAEATTTTPPRVKTSKPSTSVFEMPKFDIPKFEMPKLECRMTKEWQRLRRRGASAAP